VAERAGAGVRDAYVAKGSGTGMAAFIAMTSWRGEFTDEYFAQLAADPVVFGRPTEDDGSRDDPLLSDRSWPVSSYRPDVGKLAAAPTRVVIAVGEESLGTLTGPRGGGPPPSCSVSRRPCSPATTAASSAASSGTPANPKPSRADCARSSTTTTDRRTTAARHDSALAPPSSHGRYWISRQSPYVAGSGRYFEESRASKRRCLADVGSARTSRLALRARFAPDVSRSTSMPRT
jgi:hypothetical protein